MAETISLPELVRAAERLIAMPGRRVILGLTGPPGAGKSTVAAAIGSALGDRCAVVPMDGFHLPRAAIAGTPMLDRRGAPDTFDADAFAEAVHSLRFRPSDDLRLPAFDHLVGDPVADAVTLPAATPLIIVEGNYLLHPGAAWRRARAFLDTVWYIDADAGLRRDRLESRHRRLGRAPEDARRFVRESDEPNAAVIAQTAGQADRVVRIEQVSSAPSG